MKADELFACVKDVPKKLWPVSLEFDSSGYPSVWSYVYNAEVDQGSHFVCTPIAALAFEASLAAYAEVGCHYIEGLESGYHTFAPLRFDFTRAYSTRLHALVAACLNKIHVDACFERDRKKYEKDTSSNTSVVE